MAAFFLAFGMVIIITQACLQIIRGGDYDNEARMRLFREQKVSAPRGNITDRNGIPLALNRECSTVNISYVRMSGKERDAMYLELANLFIRNGDDYRDSFSRYIAYDPLNANDPFSYGPMLKDAASVEKWKREMALRRSDIEQLIDPAAVFKYFRTKKFSIGDEYSDEEAYKIICFHYEILIYQYSGCNPLAPDASRKTVAELEERHDEFPGITLGTGYKRKYIDGEMAAHLIGYVGAIPGERLEELEAAGYGMSDIVGITGIEYYAEDMLRGKDGIWQAASDNVTGLGPEGKLNEEYLMQPGNDVVMTIDLDLQIAAMRSLEGKTAQIRTWDVPGNYGDARAGAAVVIDVRNGEVLALASYPSYDPSAFLPDPDNKDAGKLIAQWLYDDTGLSPMFNRAIQGAYAPGSTFKPLTAIAGLEEGRVTADTVFNDTGTWTLPQADGGKTFTCLEYRVYGWSHGEISLREAIATSCNLYFNWLGYNTGIDSLNKWARYFGLGAKTGIDLPNESSGVLASRESQKYYRDDIWRPADTCIAAIGQHDNMFTPLQLAGYISAIANGGRLYTPYVL
ncbi:MAG: penicillin-binding transpeptidase domain-containing protein, partial [Eubacteriales bacterium]|nr:penicillin-binding transpeptidase domain-containing protein [Eubacteriales bacterium]